MKKVQVVYHLKTLKEKMGGCCRHCACGTHDIPRTGKWRAENGTPDGGCDGELEGPEPRKRTHLVGLGRKVVDEILELFFALALVEVDCVRKVNLACGGGFICI
jgi:hypothetical protein